MPESPMPKLVIKQQLPPPSAQDKLAALIQKVLPVVLVFLVLSTAVAFYMSVGTVSNKTETAKPAADVPVSQKQQGKPVQGAPVQGAAAQSVGGADKIPATDAKTGLPPGVQLPPGVCPLFGPGAASCKPGKEDK
jgi:hypothetical protein